ncbi:MAG: type II secretion system protein N [Wenzhouxiangellaceae bacterium]|nr:type II secretion system protein N [Wenzhouxiangellaceae bacterium]
MNRLSVPFDIERLAGWLQFVLIVACLLLALRAVLIAVDGVAVEFRPIEYQPVARTTLPTVDGRAAAGLFGNAVLADHGFDVPLPATPLELRLRGTVSGERGYAIIVDARGDEDVYRVDDELPGGARVIAIESRRVVLERAGLREALELSAGLAARASRPPPTVSENVAPAVQGLGVASFASFADGLRLDPAALAREITILPVAGGGFRVSAGRNAAVFQALGLQRNDIVLAINGRPVDNQADLRALFETLDPGQGLAITVRRGDQQRVLTPGLDGWTGELQR